MRALALGLSLLCATTAWADGPSRRFAIVVGNDSGGDGTRDLAYALEDAKKIHDILLRLGGVRAEDAALVLDGTADDVSAALADVEGRSAAARGRGERTSLFFYYSGHAKDGQLRLGKTKLGLDALKSRIAQAPIDVKIAVLDACRSGALTRTKGVRHAPAFEVESDANRAAKGLVILTSSSADEDSQESDTIGGSYFSHHLASGLLGDADQSGDRRITLSEAYAYAYQRTLADTADSAAGPQHATFSFDLAGNGDIVITDTASRREGVLLPAQSPAGSYFFVDPKGFVVAEVAHTLAIDRLVALPVGKYWVKRRLPDRLRLGQIEVAEGQIVMLDEARLKNARYADDPVKGAQVNSLYTRHWSLAASGGYQVVFDAPPERGGYFPSAPAVGVDVILHNAFGRGFGVGFDGSYGFASGVLQTARLEATQYSYSVIAVGATGFYEWAQFRVVPFIGIHLALNIMSRQFPGTTLPSQGYQTIVPGAVLGAKLRLSTSFGLVARARLHYLLYNVDETKSLGFAEFTALVSYEFRD